MLKSFCQLPPAKHLLTHLTCNNLTSKFQIQEILLRLVGFAVSDFFLQYAIRILCKTFYLFECTGQDCQPATGHGLHIDVQNLENTKLLAASWLRAKSREQVAPGSLATPLANYVSAWLPLSVWPATPPWPTMFTSSSVVNAFSATTLNAQHFVCVKSCKTFLGEK